MKQIKSKENEDKKDEVKMPIIKQFYNYGVGVSGADTSVVEVKMIPTKLANVDNEEKVDKLMSEDQTQPKLERLDVGLCAAATSGGTIQQTKAMLERQNKVEPFRDEPGGSLLSNKAGMTNIVRDMDRTTPKVYKKEVVDAVTIPETPPMVCIGVVGNNGTPQSTRALKTVRAEQIGEDAKWRFYRYWSQFKKKAFAKSCTKRAKKGMKKVGFLRAWHPSRIQYTTLRARHKGYHRRTEINKKIYRIGKGYKMKDGKLTKGSFLYHDKVKVPGPKKLVKMKPLEGSVRLRIAAQAPADSAQI